MSKESSSVLSIQSGLKLHLNFKFNFTVLEHLYRVSTHTNYPQLSSFILETALDFSFLKLNDLLYLLLYPISADFSVCEYFICYPAYFFFMLLLIFCVSFSPHCNFDSHVARIMTVFFVHTYQINKC